MLKKEASYFGDTITLPFMDRYELVVLKTIAICEFGVSCFYLDSLYYAYSILDFCSTLECMFDCMQVENVTAAYVMKCDDDTFVRVDAVLKEIDGISSKKSLYMGNLNLLHRPLRNGKWAVTYEVWEL